MISARERSIVCSFPSFWTVDKMCHQSCCTCVSVEEPIATEEFLLIYCKPIELYNILQRRGQQSPSFLPRCLRYKMEANSKTGLTDGNIIFNYRDQNDVIRNTEVTREFSCPFCLMRCASFKGLRYHLTSSHDLLKFEFWVTEEYRAVNVSVKIDVIRSEILTNGIDPRLQSFSFCSKPRKRKRPENPLENAKYVYPHIFESGSPILGTEGIDKGFLGKNDDEEATDAYPCATDLQNSSSIVNCYKSQKSAETGLEPLAVNADIISIPVARAQSSEDMECIQVMPVDQPIPPLMPNAKPKKLSLERSDSKSCLLQKRQFFHSHRAQPMTLEQVLSNRDSEDEFDDGIADLEDRRMLDDFVDVTKDEKHLMHLWNSFVRKQRVLADGHVPWACEAFLQLHGQELVRAPPLFWCWRLFMIKLWNHGLLDSCTMNNCSLILHQHQNNTSEDRKS